MIALLLSLCALSAPPSIRAFEELVFPKIHRRENHRGETLIWAERDQQITEIEVFFSQGGEEDIEGLRWVTKHWQEHAKKYELELLYLGAYMRFSMTPTHAYAQISVIQGNERASIKILKKILRHIPSQTATHKRVEKALPWTMSSLLSTIEASKKDGYQQTGGSSVVEDSHCKDENFFFGNFKIGDQILKFKNQNLCFKIDVERHEIQVLKGLQNTLKNNKIVLMIEIYEKNFVQSNALLNEIGFELKKKIKERSNYFYSNF